MDSASTETTPNNNRNTRDFPRHQTPRRDQIPWEHVKYITHGPLTARVTVLAYEVPIHSMVVGIKMPDGDIKPFVQFRIRTWDDLGKYTEYGEAYRVVTSEGHAYILATMRDILEKREAAEAARAAAEAARIAAEAEEVKRRQERKQHKKKLQAANHAKRAEENRQRAQGGGGGKGKGK